MRAVCLVRGIRASSLRLQPLSKSFTHARTSSFALKHRPNSLVVSPFGCRGLASNNKGNAVSSVARAKQEAELHWNTAAEKINAGNIHEAELALSRVLTTTKGITELEPMYFTTVGRLADFALRQGRFTDAFNRFWEIVDMTAAELEKPLTAEQKEKVAPALGLALFQALSALRGGDLEDSALHLDAIQKILENTLVPLGKEVPRALETDEFVSFVTDLALSYHQIGKTEAAREVVKRHLLEASSAPAAKNSVSSKEAKAANGMFVMALLEPTPEGRMLWLQKAISSMDKLQVFRTRPKPSPPSSPHAKTDPAASSSEQKEPQADTKPDVSTVLGSSFETQYLSAYVNAGTELASIASELGQHENAMNVLGIMLETTRNALGDTHILSLQSAKQFIGACVRAAEAMPNPKLYSRAYSVVLSLMDISANELEFEASEILADIGDLYLQNRIFEVGAQVMYRSLEIREQRLGNQAVNLVTAERYFDLGMALMEQRAWADAEESLKRALQMKKALVSAMDPSVTKILHSLGTVHMYTEKFSEAEKELLEAEKRYTAEAKGPASLSSSRQNKQASVSSDIDSVGLALVYSSLGELYYLRDDMRRAEKLCKKSLAMKRRILPSSPQLANELNNLATIYQNSGRQADAVPILKELNQLVEELEKSRPGSLPIAMSYYSTALALAQTGATEEAITAFAKAVPVISTSTELPPEVATEILSKYLAFLNSQNKEEEAQRLQKLLEKRSKDAQLQEAAVESRKQLMKSLQEGSMPRQI